MSAEATELMPIENLYFFCLGVAFEAMQLTSITNAYVFFGIATLVLGYLLYMMIRKRRGERPGTSIREPEL